MFGKVARCPGCLGPIRIGPAGQIQAAVARRPVTSLGENGSANRLLPEPEPEPEPETLPEPPAAPRLPDEPATRPCLVCGEAIRATARKCRHCGEFLDGTRPARAADGPPEPAALFYVVSLVVPLAGILLGALYLSKPSPACKDFGRTALTCSLVQFALGCVLLAIGISVVLFAIGVGSMS